MRMRLRKKVKKENVIVRCEVISENRCVAYILGQLKKEIVAYIMDAGVYFFVVLVVSV